MSPATGYTNIAADGADSVDVTAGSEEHPFRLIIKTKPLSSHIFLDRAAASVLVAGLVELLARDDADATGPLLDRLVETVAGVR